MNSSEKFDMFEKKGKGKWSGFNPNYYDYYAK